MRALVALVVLASGCAGDAELDGSYLVRAAYVSSPCGTDRPTTSSTMRLTFTSNLALSYTYTRCTDAAGTVCPDEYFNWFDERIDDGWRGTFSQAGPLDETHCAIDRIVHTATMQDGHLVLDTTFSTGELELPQSECTEAIAPTTDVTLRCTDHERLEATKL